MGSWSWHVGIGHVQWRSKTMSNKFSNQLVDHHFTLIAKVITIISLHFHSLYNFPSCCNLINSFFPHQKHFGNCLKIKKPLNPHFSTWKFNYSKLVPDRSTHAISPLCIITNFPKLFLTSFHAKYLESQANSKPPLKMQYDSN